MVLRAGDLQVGYKDFALRYWDAVFVEGLRVAQRRLTTPSAAIVYDEFCVIKPDLFEHGLLFARGGALYIRFHGFRVTSVPAASQKRKPSEPEFLVR